MYDFENPHYYSSPIFWNEAAHDYFYNECRRLIRFRWNQSTFKLAWVIAKSHLLLETPKPNGKLKWKASDILCYWEVLTDRQESFHDFIKNYRIEVKKNLEEQSKWAKSML